MQTEISAEEFSRFQAQLLELREQKYSADEECNQSNKRVRSLEEALAQRSGELAELRSSLSRIQRAGDIETVSKENHTLRQRLINIESSFQVQASTLRAECERLQSENDVLLSTLKTVGVAKESNDSTATIAPGTNRDIQTDTVRQSYAFSQTYKAGWGHASLQTDITGDHIDELNRRLEQLSGTICQLQKERENSESLHSQLRRCQLVVERLEVNCEVLRNDLAVNTRRAARIQQELKRQLASALRSANQSSTKNLSSSPMYVQQGDTISIGSFSLCGSGGDNEVCGRTLDPDEATDIISESSSISSTQPSPVFSEEDLKNLLSRLSEVQEENCSLRRQLSAISAELEAKSILIQQRFPISPLPQSDPNPAPGDVIKSRHSGAAVATHLVSGVLSTVRAKIRQLESSTSHNPPSLNSTEFRSLKRLCEELMTRNVSLELALEHALSPSSSTSFNHQKTASGVD